MQRRSAVYYAVVVIGVWSALFMSDQLLSSVTLSNSLQDFVTLTLSIFIEAFPFIVLGSLLASAVSTYVPPHLFDKYLPDRPAARRAVLSLLGFMFPVCECGNVPLSRSLMVRGMRPSEAITFLLAAPVINPVTIWATWTAFSYDGSIVVSRIVATLVIANIIGYVISVKKRQHEFLTDSFVAVCDAAKKPGQEKGSAQKFITTFNHEMRLLIKLLAIGAIIAGLVQAFVPRDILIGIGSNVLLSIFAMLLLAFVVSICASVDAFFALAFASTFTAGSIVSFLVFGPMIDIKMLTLLKTTFRTSLLAIITVLVGLMSVLTGLVVTYVF